MLLEVYKAGRLWWDRFFLLNKPICAWTRRLEIGSQCHPIWPQNDHVTQLFHLLDIDVYTHLVLSRTLNQRFGHRDGFIYARADPRLVLDIKVHLANGSWIEKGKGLATEFVSIIRVLRIRITLRSFFTSVKRISIMPTSNGRSSHMKAKMYMYHPAPRCE